MKNVLIVDDDKKIIEMVKTVLEMNDMVTHGVTKGASVYDCIEEYHPDVILMDVYLGDSDGRALCYDLKHVDKYKEIPVLLYSAGYITDVSIMQAQANDFLAKPFDIDKLVNKLNALVANPHLQYMQQFTGTAETGDDNTAN